MFRKREVDLKNGETSDTKNVGFSPKEKRELRNNPSLLRADEISFHNGGTATARQGFFYRRKGALERMEAAINEYGLRIIDSGTHDAPFRGDASLSKSSHYWVKFTKGEQG